jgi:hypothetical protein
VKIYFSILALFVVGSITATTQSRPEPTRCPGVNAEYEQLLDSYFAHVRGTSSTAIVLRVYGGRQAEYEIVIDPQISPNRLFRYSASEPIAQTVYSLAGVHRTMQEYTAAAVMIPAAKTEADLSESQFRDIVARAKSIDASICEKLPLTNHRGHAILVFDVPWFEFIRANGQTRSRTTDADRVVVNQNPSLLHWGRNLEKVFENTRSAH